MFTYCNININAYSMCIKLLEMIVALIAAYYTLLIIFNFYKKIY